MTETGPRKGLWELMGQKGSEEDPLPSPPPSEEQGIPDVLPDVQGGDATVIIPPTPEPQPLDLSESLPDNKPRGRGLWQLMQQAEEALPTVEDTDPDEIAPITSHGMRSAFEAPVKGADKRLRQMEAPEVEIVEEEEDVEVEQEPVELELEQAEPPENAPLPADLIEAIADTRAARTSPELETGLSRSALWSIILGFISLPVSLIAIYPAIWSRIPSFACGFGALMLGYLAYNEIQRSRGKRQGLFLAYSGMATGLFGMFAGPAIYAPLDLYGKWCNQHTQGHLRQIGLATEAYFQQHHSFPSGGQFREVKQGEPQPMHGWMTLLLPNLPEGSGLSKQIDYSRPYDDPANQAAMSQIVSPFLAAGGSSELIQGKFGPAHFSGLGGITRLPDGTMAHVGVFDTNSATTREDILDGASNTLMAGEISSNYPAWGDPRNWRKISKGLNRGGDSFGNAQHTGAMFLMADGSVRFLTNATDPKVLQALSTRDGEEKP